MTFNNFAHCSATCKPCSSPKCICANELIELTRATRSNKRKEQ